MNLYRIQSFAPGAPAFSLEATQAGAFKAARDLATDDHAPEVALIQLATAKADLVDALNNPQAIVGQARALRLWVFTKARTRVMARELDPSTGDPLRPRKVRLVAREFKGWTPSSNTSAGWPFALGAAIEFAHAIEESAETGRFPHDA